MAPIAAGALGIGGLPRGRVVEVYGPESSGKTTVALHAVANAQKAGGIILVGIQPSVVAASLADAAAAGIPVQNTLNGDPGDAVPANEYDNFTSAFSENGTQEADWALLDSGCQADTVILDSSSISVWKAMGDAAKKEFAALPEG